MKWDRERVGDEKQWENRATMQGFSEVPTPSRPTLTPQKARLEDGAPKGG